MIGSSLVIAVALGVAAGPAEPEPAAVGTEPVAAPEPAGPPEPSAEPEPEPEPAPSAAPAPAAATTTTEVAGTGSHEEAAVRAQGLVPGIAQRNDTWVPNNWPVQQVCDFVSVKRQTCIVADTEIYAGWRYDRSAKQSFNAFRLDRAQAGTAFIWKPYERIEGGVRFSLEAVRSAGQQSLIGIAGNSLVVRMLTAYGQFVVHAGPIDIGVRGGLVPGRWIQQVEKGYDLRGVAPLPSDGHGMFDRSDLGGTVTVSGWKGLVELDLQVVNGEGRAQQELNRGKNTTIMAAVRPINRMTDKGPIILTILGGYRDGSIGVASARNHRGSAAITFASPWVYAGFEYAQALGYQQRANLEANTVGGWASGWVWSHWIALLGGYDRVQPDLGNSRTAVHRITAGVFSDLFPQIDRNRRRVRLYATYQYDKYGADAAPLPGSPAALDTHRFLLQLQVRGVLRAW